MPLPDYKRKITAGYDDEKEAANANDFPDDIADNFLNDFLEDTALENERNVER